MSFMKLFALGMFACIGIFLFATAPPELPEANANLSGGTTVNTADLFDTANAINNAARLVYTKRIVGGGKKAGLKFGEDWAEPGIEKGPLPALFLRLVAGRLERKPAPLGLYLGSDEPINKSNLFSPDQMAQFEQVKQTLRPQFSNSGEARMVAMYPDLATARPCVDCHNEHTDSPKTDWKMGDVMGATTWTYPKDTISQDELLNTSRAVLASVAEAYEEYLARTSLFGDPVVVGEKWPSEGARQLPNVDVFMKAVTDEFGAAVAGKLLNVGQAEKGETS